MDEELLCGKGLEPEGGEIAAIDGFALRIGPSRSVMRPQMTYAPCHHCGPWIGRGLSCGRCAQTGRRRAWRRCRTMCSVHFKDWGNGLRRVPLNDFTLPRVREFIEDNPIRPETLAPYLFYTKH